MNMIELLLQGAPSNLVPNTLAGSVDPHIFDIHVWTVSILYQIYVTVLVYPCREYYSTVHKSILCILFMVCPCLFLCVYTCSELLEERQTKIQREVVDARHGVSFVMVWADQ